MPYLNAQLTDFQGCCFHQLGICQPKNAMGVAPAAFIVWALPDLFHAELQLPITHSGIALPENCRASITNWDQQLPDVDNATCEEAMHEQAARDALSVTYGGMQL